jgi:hypothetical protein
MVKSWQEKLYNVYEFVFVEDGPYSIAAFCLVAYLGIRFIVFPVIGFVAGTSLPIVAVISNSMVHGDGWEESPAMCDGSPCSQEEYYERRNISMAQFDSFRFDDGFNKGDVMLVRGEDSYEVGDVVVYRAANKPPIIHRVIEVKGSDEYVVKGDNNYAPMQETGEFNLDESRIIGSAYARLPFLGWVKIGLVNALRSVAEVFV